MDDAGTEHERGWLRIEDGARQRGRRGQSPPRRREDVGGPRAARSSRRACQHAPPPLPDAHARPGAGGRPLHLAAHALPHLGAHRRRDGVRRGAHRPRRARALGLLDRVRPPLRLPARRHRARRGRAAGGARARRAHGRLARVDGPRRLRRRPAARRARRGHGRDPRRHRAPRRARRRRHGRASPSPPARRSRSRRA